MAGKTPSIDRVRNIGIMAHIDAGKTTVTERLLFVTGKAYKMGEVHEGEATMDWMVQERERGITITSAVTTFEWMNHEVHLIDTPGHVDFTIEVSRSLRVLDGAVAVFDGVAGVEPQTETVWRQADVYGVPRLGFVNKLDRIGASFERCLEMMEKRFGEHCAPVQLPIGLEGEHEGVVDLIALKAYRWLNSDDPREIEEGPVPEHMTDEVALARETLFERIALADEDFAMLYLEDSESITEETIHEAIRGATIAGDLVPVLCGSALRNKGIQPLLNAIIAWLPSPTDVPEVTGIDPRNDETISRPHDPKAPLSALAYKIAIMEDGRRMVFMRLYSGTLTAGSTLENPALGLKEKVSRIFLMHANHRERKDKIEAGNIFAVLGLKKTRTGDTLCDPANPILLEAIDSYEPVISQALEPETLAEKAKIEESLAKLADEDPTFRWHEDQGTGQTIIRGMGELHLEILVDRLRREFGVGVRTGRPQVVYRETINSAATHRESFERALEAGDKLIFGDVTLRVDPLERGQGNQVMWDVDGSMSAAELALLTVDLRGLIENSIEQGFGSGVLEGYPVLDTGITVTHVGFKEGATDEMGYRAAASNAMREALRKADPVRMSPVGSVEISTPPEHTGEVIGSINQRRGRIESMEERSPMVSVISATVAMEQMFGYTTELRSMTQGRASYTMTFSHFDRL
jgi:elongation factor G